MICIFIGFVYLKGLTGRKESNLYSITTNPTMLNLCFVDVENILQREALTPSSLYGMLMNLVS